MRNLLTTLLLPAVLLAPCIALAEISPTLPEEIFPDRHYLFYLHGQIVEGSDGRPVHQEHGTYDYPKILDVLESKGFWVISEVRRKNTSPAAYAGLISFYVDQLQENGVPASNITVVGASKGGIIACYVSNLQKDPDINYVILAGFFNRLKNDPKMLVTGRVLSIHDSSDQNGINPKYFLRKSDVSEEKVKVTRHGWGHGLIFQPRDAWVRELVTWTRINKKKKEKD